MSEIKFFPDQWQKQLWDGYLERAEASNRMHLTLMGIDPDNMETTSEERPLTAEYLAARKRFKKRWKRLTRNGIKMGFLDSFHGELSISRETTEWVSIPNPNYDPSKPNPYKLDPNATSVIIPVVRRTND